MVTVNLIVQDGCESRRQKGDPDLFLSLHYGSAACCLLFWGKDVNSSLTFHKASAASLPPSTGNRGVVAT